MTAVTARLDTLWKAFRRSSGIIPVDGMQDTRSVQNDIIDNNVVMRQSQPVRGDDAMGRKSSGRRLHKNGQGASPDFCADIGQLTLAETTAALPRRRGIWHQNSGGEVDRDRDTVGT